MLSPSTDDTLRPPVAASLAHLLSAATAVFESDQDAAKDLLRRAMALLPRTLPRDATTAAKKHRGTLAPWQMRKVTAFIEANLHGHIRAMDLATTAHLSSSHFSRTFKTTYGMAPCIYVARYRIERAKQLMLNTQEALSRIALDCGLCDQSHFTRMFRRMTGMSPSLWRRQFVSAPAP